MPVKRCGTCKFWNQFKGTNRGRCMAPVPSSQTPYLVELHPEMYENQGQFCPVWEEDPTKNPQNSTGVRP